MFVGTDRRAAAAMGISPWWYKILAFLIAGAMAGIAGALSLLAVAGHGAVEHLLAWARRLVALLAARVPRLRGVGRVFTSTARLRSLRAGSVAAPRGPPVRSFSTT